LQTGIWFILNDYWCYRGPKLGVRPAFDESVKDNGCVVASLYCDFSSYSRAYICHTL